MTISLKHAFTNPKSDSGDTTIVQPSDWNDEHTMTMATARMLGRTTAGTGAVEEITVGNSLLLSGGALSGSVVQENAQTGTSYTLVLTDAGGLVSLSNASGITLTIPTNAVVAFPVNTRIDIVQWGAGQVTVGGSGVTIRSSGGKLKLTGQYSGATLWKRDTDEWLLLGDITT